LRVELTRVQRLYSQWIYNRNLAELNKINKARPASLLNIIVEVCCNLSSLLSTAVVHEFVSAPPAQEAVQPPLNVCGS